MHIFKLSKTFITETITEAKPVRPDSVTLSCIFKQRNKLILGGSQ